MIKSVTSPIFKRQGEDLIRIDEGTHGYTFIDSARDASNDTNWSVNELVISGNNDILSKQVSQYAVYSTGYVLENQQVNARNSTVQFYSSNTGGVGGTLFSVTVGHQYYASESALMTGLITALNTVTGSSGLTFSFAVSPQHPLKFTLSAVGGTFCFALQSSDRSIDTNLGVVNGKFLWNLPREQVLSASKIVGMVLGFYSRYMDIVSVDLTDNVRIPASSFDKRLGSNLLFRLFVDQNNTFNPAFKEFTIEDPVRWIKKLRSKSIKKIDLRIYDEFGQDYIMPSIDNDTPNNSWVDLVLLTK